MSRARRFGRRFAAIAVLTWAAGLIAIWWLLPPAPRDGWQLPLSQRVLGFLSDNRTLVTTPVSGLKTGPIRLLDVQSRRLVAEHLGDQGGHEGGIHLAAGDLIHVHERAAGTEKDEHKHVLRLIDAWAGNEVVRFACRAPDGVLWSVSPDGRTTAFVTYDERDQPRLECYEIASGKLLHATPGYGGGFFYSSDGSRLLAIKERPKQPPTRPLTVMILDAVSGDDVATFPQVPNARMLLSGRGRMLLDGSVACWDVAAKRAIFNTPPGLRGPSYAFAPEEDYLVALSLFGQQWWLTYYRTDDGQEQVDRAALLGGTESLLLDGAHLAAVTPDARLFVVEGTLGLPGRGTSSLVEKIRAFLRGRRPVADQSPDLPQHVCLLIEAGTGREVARLDGQYPCFSPDGRLAISTTPDGVYQLWDVPPRRSRRAFLFWGSIWTAVLALIALRRAVNVSRRRAGACAEAGKSSGAP